ncbi:MAG: elongation factor G [Planctomycetota bacterium]
MAAASSVDTRNFTLVGHGGSGKTTLAEAILFASKAINRQGSIGDKNTVSDFADDECERGHSIDSAVLRANWKGKNLNILDAPGYQDFNGQARRTFDGVDCAVVVINAYDGVGLNTHKMFNGAREHNLPCIVVVNRCDSDNINIPALDASIQALFGQAAKAVTLPETWGPGCSAVKSIFNGDGDLEGFVEAAVEADDDLMEKYLDAGEVSDDDLKKAIPLALQAGTLIPIFHTVATTGVGVTDLLDFIADFGPAPEGRVIHDMDGNEIVCGADKPFLAVCFKITFDRQAVRVTFLRVLCGSLRPADMAKVDRTDETVKIGHIHRFQGNSKSETEQATAGDIIALPKVDGIEVGDTLHDPAHPVKVKFARGSNPMVGLSLKPKARGDDAKIGKELGRIVGADPALVYERTSDTNELVVRGLSTLHLDIALKRLAVAGVEVDTAPPKVAYLETITAKAEGHHRHKKQTGGAGQFGEVYLRVEPIARGADDPLEFENKTVGGSIPRQFVPAIEKGIRQMMMEGVLSGNRVVDVKVSVYDGKFHDVDSKEIAFIVAGRKAFAQAIEKARPVLLEPVVTVEIEIPSNFMGDITSDLNSRRARIQGMDSVGDRQLIKAEAPLSEMQTYSTQLRSITGGEGSFSMDFSHYDIVPGQVAQQIVARHKASKKDDSD